MITMVLCVLLSLIAVQQGFISGKVVERSLNREIGSGLYSQHQIDQKQDEFFELDMKIPENLRTRQRRGVLIQESMKWNDATVPYEFDGVLAYSPLSASEKEAAMEAFRNISGRTCVKFIRRTTQNNYLQIARMEQFGCWSYVGMKRGAQTLNVGEGCGTKKTMIHELLHALGFLHEHNRPDRDQYVTVNLQNIQSGAEKSFQKFALSMFGGISLAGIPYDVSSVMHYSRYAFTKFRGVNVPQDDKDYMSIYYKQDPKQRLGSLSDSLSDKDIERVNKRYCTNQVTTTANLTTDSQTQPTEITKTTNPSTEITKTKNPSTEITKTKNPSTEITKTTNPSTEITKTKNPSTESHTTENPPTEQTSSVKPTLNPTTDTITTPNCRRTRGKKVKKIKNTKKRCWKIIIKKKLNYYKRKKFIFNKKVCRYVKPTKKQGFLKTVKDKYVLNNHLRLRGRNKNRVTHDAKRKRKQQNQRQRTKVKSERVFLKKLFKRFG